MSEVARELQEDNVLHVVSLILRRDKGKETKCQLQREYGNEHRDIIYCCLSPTVYQELSVSS